MHSTLGFVLLALFMIKHFFVDWVLQTDEMARNKGNNIRLLLLHAAEHAGVTAVITLLFVPWQQALIVSIGEGLLHTLIDFLKSNTHFFGKIQWPSKHYFIVTGADQLLHQLTYLTIVWYLLS